MKVNSLQRMASPAAADGGAPDLRRSASAKQAPSPSPLGANNASSRQQQQPPRASTSTPAPGYPRHAQKPPSISCMAAKTTDTPPATPRGITKQPSSASSSSYYASMFSPRKLMQRASRAFHRSGRSRRKKNAPAPAAADGGDVDSPRSVASKGSDAESVFSLDDQIIADGAAAKKQQEEEEVVPEKIIHEANPSPAPVAAEEKDEGRKDTPEKETSAAEEEAEAKKDPAPPTAEDVPDEIPAAKEAVKEEIKAEVVKEQREEEIKAEVVKEQREEEIKAEVVKGFQGRRARTTPAERRESARSNEAIEEARVKLLDLRQGNKVKALVGAFETVMDGNHRRAAAGKPQLNLRV